MYYNTTTLFANKSALSAKPRRIKNVSVLPELFNLNDPDHGYSGTSHIYQEHQL